MSTIRLLLLPLLYLFIYHFNVVLTKSPSVIIVGAGPSGIAAATKLLENSFTNITILEAEDRIGGRIHTVEFENCVVDVGAQYCHGEKGNIVYELVKDLNLLEASPNFTHEFLNLYNSDGSRLPPDLAQDLIDSASWFIDDDDDDNDDDADDGVTLKEAFFKKYNSTILKKYSSDANKLKIAKSALPFLESIIVSYEGSFSWDELPTQTHFVDSEGDHSLTWKKRGYRIILDILMKSYPDPSKKLAIDDKISLNKKVKTIKWSGKEVTIQTVDDASFSADHVIFTPSLGVLKSQMDTLFEPQLPQEKKEAVEALGFDGVMKIILHFPTKWWKDEDFAFSFVWNDQDLLQIKNEFPEGPYKDGRSWISYMSSMVPVHDDYNILIAWVTGELIPQIETMPEDVALRGCNYLLRKFLSKNYNVTDADKVLRSQWVTNPNFRGTYSFEKFGYYKKEVSYNSKLAEPLTDSEGRPALLFAGEATSPTHFSTVHGAIESGMREAERIIKLYKH